MKVSGYQEVRDVNGMGKKDSGFPELLEDFEGLHSGRSGKLVITKFQAEYKEF